MLEFSFFLNLCITSALWTISEQHSYVVVYISISIVMLTFLGILVYDISARTNLNICARLKPKVSLTKVIEKIPFKDHIKPYFCPSELEDDSERTLLLPQPVSTVVRYRDHEPLIDDTDNN